MKCLRKFSIGLKLSVIVVLLLLLVSQLSAIPAFLTGSETGKLISQLQDTTVVMELVIAEKDLLIEQQEMQLTALRKDLENSKGNTLVLESTILTYQKELEKSKEESANYKLLVANTKKGLQQLESELYELMLTSTNSSDVDAVLKERLIQMEKDQASLKTQLEESAITTAKLQSEIAATKVLLNLTDAEYSNLLDNNLVPLQEAYDAKAAEADQYYQDLVNARADNNPGFIGEFGAEGLYFPGDGEFGAGVHVGIGWGDLVLTVGAQYKLKAPIIFDFGDITYSAGLTYRF